MLRMLLSGATLAVAITSIQLVGVGAEEPPVQNDSRAKRLQAVFVVSEYDDSRDPSKDLATAKIRAQRGQKRIILEVGRRRCAWCQALDVLIRKSDSVAKELHENYLIVKVPDSLEQPIFSFLADYPTVHETPHWFVLDENGKLLHSQNVAAFETGGSYSEAKIVKFLQSWKPATPHTTPAKP